MTEPLDPLEKLAQLAPQSPRFGVVGHGTAKRLWAREDIAAALSGRAAGDPTRLRNAHLPTLLVLVKYAMDRPSVYPLEIAWWYEVVGMAVRGDWLADKNGMPRLRIVADATLTEFIAGARCSTCGGAGLMHNQAECTACGGGGVQVRGAGWWGIELQLRKATTLDAWMPRIRSCFVRLQELEAEARGALAAGSREGELVTY
jgi:hypothetical protein